MDSASDEDLAVRRAVQDEMVWTPDVDAASIDVSITDGTVALFGEVTNSSERIAAKPAALRVVGGRAADDNLSVRPTRDSSPSETEIAKEVEHALAWVSDVPDIVTARESSHSVTLTGEVDWDSQPRFSSRAAHQTDSYRQRGDTHRNRQVSV